MTGPTAGPLVVMLPWKAPPLSLNDRKHWRPAAEQRAQVREAAQWAIRAARPPRLPAAEVVLCWRVRDLQRRDLDNMAATLKPCLDALVREGVLPDDDWMHVRQTSSRIDPPNAERTTAVWLELSERRPWKADG